MTSSSAVVVVHRTGARLLGLVALASLLAGITVPSVLAAAPVPPPIDAADLPAQGELAPHPEDPLEGWGPPPPPPDPDAGPQDVRDAELVGPAVDPEDISSTSPGGAAVGIYDGQLSIGLPLYSAPVGGSVHLALGLNYGSGGVWPLGGRVNGGTPGGVPYGHGEAGLGWRLTLGRIGYGGGNNDLALHLPDGSSRGLYQLGVRFQSNSIPGADGFDQGGDPVAVPPSRSNARRLITRDGSYIRVMTIGGPGAACFRALDDPATYDFATERATSFRAFMPDGTFIEYDHFVAPVDDPGVPREDSLLEGHHYRRDRGGWYPTLLVDPFGNKVQVEYHDAPYSHVIRTMRDSHCREIHVAIHEGMPPGEEWKEGLVESVTYPVFTPASGVEPCYYWSAAATFSYELRQVTFPVRPWSAAEAATVTDVPLLREIRIPTTTIPGGVEIVHSYDYNMHGELSLHRLPEGGAVAYRHDYWAGGRDPLAAGATHHGARGVDRRTTYVDGDTGNSSADNAYTWWFLRDSFMACTATDRPRRMTRIIDPVGRVRHVRYVNWDDRYPAHFGDVYDPVGTWRDYASPLVQEVTEFDVPFGHVSGDDFVEELDACGNPPAGVGTFRGKTHWWETDSLVVPSGSCTETPGAPRPGDAVPRLLTKVVTRDDGSYLRLDACGWYFGRFISVRLSGSPGLVPHAVQIMRGYQDVMCNGILGLVLGEYRYQDGEFIGSDHRYDLNGRRVLSVLRGARRTANFNPDDLSNSYTCENETVVPRVISHSAFGGEHQLGGGNSPNSDPLALLQRRCGTELDPEPQPTCTISAWPTPTPDPLAGDVRMRYEYYGSACEPDNGTNGPAWGQLRRVVTDGGDDGSVHESTYEWTHGALSSVQHLGVPWKAIDRRIDLSTGTAFSTKTPSGEELITIRDALGRVTSALPMWVAPAPGPGAERAARTTFTYAANSRDLDERSSESFASPGTETAERYFTRDGLGRLTRIERRAANDRLSCKVYRYDALDRVVFESEWFWSGPDARASIGDPQGTTFDYTVAGTVGVVPEPGGRLTALRTGDGGRVTSSYFGSSTTSVIDGVNGIGAAGALAITTTRTVDWAGRVLSVDAPSTAQEPGADATYEYDITGQLARSTITSPGGEMQVRTYVHDGLGRLRSATEPESGTTLLTRYSALGAIVSKRIADGTILTYDYDDVGRLEQVSAQPPTGAAVVLVSYAYDGASQASWGKVVTTRTTSPAGDVVREFEYEGVAGRWSAVRTSWGATTWTSRRWYDAFGNIAARDLPAAGGSAPRRLSVVHARGWPVTMTDESTGAVVVSGAKYGPDGSPTNLNYGNAVQWHATLDERNRVSKIDVTDLLADPWPLLLWTSGTTVYDGANNVIAEGLATDVPTPAVLRTHRYDRLRRLVASQVRVLGATPVTHEFTYAHDAFGNLTTRSWTRAGVSQCDPAGEWTFTGRRYANGGTPQVPVTNRVSDWGTGPCAAPAAPQLDGAGRLLRDSQGRILTWNALDRVATVTVGGVSSSYAYDHAGWLVVERVGTTATITLRDVDGFVEARLHSVGGGPVSTVSEHASFGGRLVASAAAAQPFARWHYSDAMGTTRLTLDESTGTRQIAVDERTPFGASLAPGGASDSRVFGHDADASALLVAHHRRYLASEARFLSPDLDRGRVGDPLSQNRYVYALGNPTSYVDRDGRHPALAAIGVGAAAGGLSNSLGYLIEHAISGEPVSAAGLGSAFVGGAVAGAAEVGVAIGASMLGHPEVGLAAAPFVGGFTESVVQNALDPNATVTLAGTAFDTVFQGTIGHAVGGPLERYGRTTAVELGNELSAGRWNSRVLLRWTTDEQFLTESSWRFGAKHAEQALATYLTAGVSSGFWWVPDPSGGSGGYVIEYDTSWSPDGNEYYDLPDSEPDTAPDP